MKQINKKEFKDLYIPKEIFSNKKLNLNEKAILTEIIRLHKKDGCFASNKYFADFINIHKSTVSKIMSNLKKLGYIKENTFDGKKRTIKLIKNLNKKLIK